MNRLYTFLFLVAWATTAFGQAPNPRLRQLDDFLRRLPHGVEFIQKNDFSNSYIRYDWHAQLDGIGRESEKPTITREMSNEERQQAIHVIDSINAQARSQLEDALDTIRTAFALVSKEASESYRYEYHRGRSDSIIYSVAFRYDNDELDSWRNGNYVQYWNAHEAASFRYELNNWRYVEGSDSAAWWHFSDVETDTLGFETSGWYQGPFGHYYHVCEQPRSLSEEEMKPFDIVAFEAHIQPALKSMMKLKGAKSYPVYWQHDQEYVDSAGREGLPLNGGRLSSDPPAGLTTGTHYFIPARYKAEPLFQQLDSLAHDYVNRHPEQPYRYTLLPIILRILPNNYVYKEVFHTATGDIVESDLHPLADLTSTKYNLRCYHDDDGLHILSLTTKGVLWIPIGFQKMKRWVNGKATYRKK